MAIRLGYTHLDGAEGTSPPCPASTEAQLILVVYDTEPELGIAIKESGAPRSSLYVVTKVSDGVTDISAALDASLKKLQLDYVDLYLIHQPFFAKGSPEKLQAAWSAMEQIKRSGRARSIGVSNYYPADLEATMAKATIPPAINQIEYHPYLQHPAVLALHQRYGIMTEAYAPLTPVTKAKGGPVDAVMARAAKRLGVSEAVVGLRWCIEQDVVTVTTSSKESRLREYLDALKVQLSPEEVREMAREGEKKHYRGFWLGKIDKDDRS